MKHLFTFAGVFLLSVMTLHSAQLPDLSEYKDSSCTRVVMAESFNGKLDSSWKLGSGCRLEQKCGMNGTAALVMERKNPADYEAAVAKIPLKLKHNTSYIVTIKYRTALEDTDKIADHFYEGV